MHLPNNLLKKMHNLSFYQKPEVYLLGASGKKICKLNELQLKGTFNYNQYSKINFNVQKLNSSKDKVENEYFDQVQVFNLIQIEGFGLFQLQAPTVKNDGIVETKECEAFSLEYSLSQKYLELFKINTGEIDSQEVIYYENQKHEAEVANDNRKTALQPIVFYDENNKNLSLLNLILEKDNQWTIGKVDTVLKKMTREFSVSRKSIYDFIMNDICKRFNCFVDFETKINPITGEIERIINFYSQRRIQQFIGKAPNGGAELVTYQLSKPYFYNIDVLSVNGIKKDSSQYFYNSYTGIITFERKNAPPVGAYIEVVASEGEGYETDIFVGYDNLLQNATVSFDADNIKTVLNVKYGNGRDIREVNMGLPYITNLSYFKNENYMSPDLIEALTNYENSFNQSLPGYTDNTKAILKYLNAVYYEENKTSVNYAKVNDGEIDATTVGVFYVKSKIETNDYYQEVKLPYDFNANETYYSIYGYAPNVNKDTIGTYYIKDGNIFKKQILPGDFNNKAIYYSDNLANINFELMDDLQTVFVYFLNGIDEKEGSPEQVTWMTKLDMLQKSFSFLGEPGEQDSLYTLLVATLDDIKQQTNNNGEINLAERFKQFKENSVVKQFMQRLWQEAGTNILRKIYYEPYKAIQTVQMEHKLSEKNEENLTVNFDEASKVLKENYYFYYVNFMFITGIEAELKAKQNIIDMYNKKIQELQSANQNISDNSSIEHSFFQYFKNKYPTESDEQIQTRANSALIELNPFLIEDEVDFKDIVETTLDSIDSSFNNQLDAKSCGRIELEKISKPQLKIQMNLANIFALTEFLPIIDQFELGYMIKIQLNKSSFKTARLLSVTFNFEDPSSFSCQFGDLISLESNADIHADMMGQAISAGKTVANKDQYWTKGASTATAMDLKIQNGLLDAATNIKSIDGTQNVRIDKYGIHLEQIDPETKEVSKKQGWIVNNQFLYSDDGFETTKSVFGEFKIDGKDYWGLLAEAVIAGYIEGSDIVGGTIKIGKRTDGKKTDGSYNFEVDKNGNITMRSGFAGGGENLLYGSESIDEKYYDIELLPGVPTSNIQRISYGNTTYYSKYLQVKGLAKIIMKKKLETGYAPYLDYYNNKNYVLSFCCIDDINAVSAEQNADNKNTQEKKTIKDNIKITINLYNSEYIDETRYTTTNNTVEFVGSKINAFSSGDKWITCWISFKENKQITVTKKKKSDTEPEKIIPNVTPNMMSIEIETIEKTQDTLFSFYHPMLSESVTPTAWAPSNEMLQEGIENGVKYVDSQFNVLQDSINSTVTTVTEVKNDVQNIKNKVDGINPEDISGKIQKLSTKIDQTSTAVSILINKEEIPTNPSAENTYVQSVKTTNSFTFDKNGLTVKKDGADVKTSITTDGMKVTDNADQMLLTASSAGVDAKNLHATTYLIIGDHTRFESYNNNSRVGCFWII